LGDRIVQFGAVQTFGHVSGFQKSAAGAATPTGPITKRDGKAVTTVTWKEGFNRKKSKYGATDEEQAEFARRYGSELIISFAPIIAPPKPEKMQTSKGRSSRVRRS
jgi:hypothetical protein